MLRSRCHKTIQYVTVHKSDRIRNLLVVALEASFVLISDGNSGSRIPKNAKLLAKIWPPLFSFQILQYFPTFVLFMAMALSLYFWLGDMETDQLHKRHLYSKAFLEGKSLFTFYNMIFFTIPNVPEKKFGFQISTLSNNFQQ